MPTLDSIFDSADLLYQSSLQPNGSTGGRSVIIYVYLVYPNAYLPNATPDNLYTWQAYQHLTYSPGGIRTFREPTGGEISSFLPASFSGSITAVDGLNSIMDPSVTPQLPKVSVSLNAPRFVTWRAASNPYILSLSIPGYGEITVPDPEVVPTNFTGASLSLPSGLGPSFTLVVYAGPTIYPPLHPGNLGTQAVGTPKEG
jgi:hypothetical protein